MTDIVDQPPPTPIEQTGKPAVWPLVIQDLENLMNVQHPDENGKYGEIARDVVKDMQLRDQIGRERYGTPLTANNGRDQLVDAYQELLDFLVYLRAKFEELGFTPETENIDEKWIQLRAVYVNNLGSAVLIRYAMEPS